MARGGGRGGRGTGTRTLPRGRSPLRKYKKSSPRTSSQKRLSDPLFNLRQKQIKNVDSSLYSQVTKMKNSSGSDKFG